MSAWNVLPTSRVNIPMPPMKPTLGPRPTSPAYIIEGEGMFPFLRNVKYHVIRNGLTVCTCKHRHDAERIAYCLNIVEESEKTDRVA
jgi:hypothetical protein